MNADLHTHTWHSDGALAPAELVRLAWEKGVELLAITDHDNVEAYADPAVAGCDSPRLVSGIEFSTQWRRQGIHVVGLNVDLSDGPLRAGIAAQQSARELRAGKIARRLEKLGLDNVLESVRALAPRGFLGRPHFAEFLVAQGVVRDRAQAFKKHLGAGKAGDIKSDWIDLAGAIGWIRGAGGIAVLAHPAKYKMTRTRARTLLREFIAAGGEALEVVSGRQTPEVTARLSRDCLESGLLASCGSDFHAGDRSWAALGEGLALPAGLTPVWSRFE